MITMPMYGNIGDMTVDVSYGRSSDKYAKMVVLLISARGEAAAFLEAALISKLQATIGCRNIASGGEGLRPAEGPFFTYLVIAPPA